MRLVRRAGFHRGSERSEAKRHCFGRLRQREWGGGIGADVGVRVGVGRSRGRSRRVAVVVVVVTVVVVKVVVVLVAAVAAAVVAVVAVVAAGLWLHKACGKLLGHFPWAWQGTRFSTSLRLGFRSQGTARRMQRMRDFET